MASILSRLQYVLASGTENEVVIADHAQTYSMENVRITYTI